MTASHTLSEISITSAEHFHSLALHHVGQVFANPSAHPLVDSLYAFIIMVLWPLDMTDDVALLIHGAKRLASTYDHARGTLSITPIDPSNVGKSKDKLDHTRLVHPLSLLCSYLIPHALTVVYYLCERDHVSVLVPA